MSAPKGSKFWMRRSKHSGPERLFKSPEILWESACEYFEYCEDTPLLSTEYVGKDAHKVEVPKMRAFTWSGLELYLGVSSLRRYKSDDAYKNFFPVISEIGKVIYTQKLEGAAAGLLNPGLIARELGLADKKEHSGAGGEAIKTELTINVVESGPKPASSEKDLDTE